MNANGNEQLYELCRICLQKSENMKSLLNNCSQDTINILDMLTSLTNSKLELLNKSIPHQLCSKCECNLFSSFNFQKQCFKSNEYIKKMCNSSAQMNCEREVDLKKTMNIYGSSVDFKCKNNAVLEEIKRVQNTVKNCIMCPDDQPFTGTSKSLSRHMTRLHNNIKNWCSSCNEIIIDKNLKEHTKKHVREECKFCKKQVQRSDFIEHLKSHAYAGGYSTCHICKKIFDNVYHLTVHLRNNHKNCFAENEQVIENFKDDENSLLNEIEDEDFEVKQENEYESSMTDPLDIDDHDNEIEENDDENVEETENVVSKSIKWSQCKNFSVSEVVEAIKEVQKSQNIHTSCIFCPYESNTTKNLSVHITLAHSHVKNWCSFCNEVIDEDYEKHTQQHLKDAGKCKFCLKVVKRYYLVQHLKLHAGVKMFTCKTCHKSFQTIRCLKYHIKRHRNSIKSKEVEEERAASNSENTNDVQCGSESKKLKSENEEETNNESLMEVGLNFELKSNEDIAELMTLHNYCKECNQTFRNMSKHVKEIHSKSEEPKVREEFVCDLCSKKFLRKKGLRAHLMIHQNQGNYRCSYCSKLCLNKLQLIEHERVHTGERPNICSVCGKGFKQLASLNLHMRIHSERPIKCTLCEKRFCRPAELRIHMLNHSGEKPFLCSECGKGFTQKSHLRAHSQSHSDETPFQCSECSKAFKNNYALKLHSRTHSGYKALKCPYCPYGCNRSYSLKQHITKRHSVT